MSRRRARYRVRTDLKRPGSSWWFDSRGDTGPQRTRTQRRVRLQKEDVMEAARIQEGLESVAEIKFAVLEVSGNISSIKKQKSG